MSANRGKAKQTSRRGKVATSVFDRRWTIYGHLLERSPDDWDVLALPAIAPADIEIATAWNTRHLFAGGALLHSAREPAEVLDLLRRSVGLYKVPRFSKTQ
jgi:hypothetical protein